MTIASGVNRSGPYACNGVTTHFPYGFKIYDAEHIRVVLTAPDGTESALVLGTDYVVSDVGESGGGAVDMAVAYAVGYRLTLVLNVPFTQNVDLENQGAYFAETIERALDMQTQMSLQLKEQMQRAIVAPLDKSTGATIDPAILTDVAENASLVQQYRDEAQASASDAAQTASDVAGEVAPFLSHINSTNGHPLATLLASGFMSAADKASIAFASMAAISDATIPAAALGISTLGYSSVGDGGAWPLAIRVPSQPSHAGKVRSTDRYLPNGTQDLTNGGWWELRAPYVNVKMFGAKGDGTTDDATAINDAIVYAGSSSAKTSIVFMPPGDYRITSTINIGNGSVSGYSTYRGVRLVGLVAGAGISSGSPGISCVNITPDFLTTGWAIQVFGPITGWGIEDISVLCNNSFARGLYVQEGISGHVKNFSVINSRDVGVFITTLGNHTTTFNTFDSVFIFMHSGTTGAIGLMLTGTGACNTCFNTFNRLHITPTHTSHQAISLQYCDNNDFYGLDINPVGATAVLFDYTTNSAFPSSNHIFGVDPYDNTFSINGTPGATARKNGIYGFSLTNGATPPSINNLSVLTDNLAVSGSAIGYSRGASVTQATSKSTAVTIDAPAGRITMNAAALAAGASVIFIVSNTFCQSSCTMVATPVWQSASDAYSVKITHCGGGFATLKVTNETGTSRSEALIIDFAVVRSSSS